MLNMCGDKIAPYLEDAWKLIEEQAKLEKQTAVPDSTRNSTSEKAEAAYAYALSLLRDYVKRGARSYENGISFEKWSERMILVHGKAAVPYLRVAWVHVKAGTTPTIEDTMKNDSANPIAHKFRLQSRKITLAVAAAAFVLAGLFPPWLKTFDAQAIHSRRNAGYAFILSPPEPEGHRPYDGIQLDTTRLLIEWSCILVFAGTAWFLCGVSKPRHDESKVP